MGGTLTTFIAFGRDLSVLVAVDISTHCWVLKEQTFFPGKKYDLLGFLEIPLAGWLVGPVIQV